MIQRVMAGLKVLAIAVATGRVGYVLIEEGRLIDWKMSKKAYRSVAEARRCTKTWIELFKPDVLVTEKIAKTSRKGEQSRSVTRSIARVAEKAPLLDVSMLRIQEHANKYVEAQVLAARFPDLAGRLPKKPRLWQSEPFAMIYFEALALALPIVDRRQIE